MRGGPLFLVIAAATAAAWRRAPVGDNAPIKLRSEHATEKAESVPTSKFSKSPGFHGWIRQESRSKQTFTLVLGRTAGDATPVRSNEVSLHNWHWACKAGPHSRVTLPRSRSEVDGS